ncbi:MAG: hypothetical protein M0T77_12270 [Actinomycetota bacterium]|nr:hypothetical protein [Actinomycetota bacterium]
MRAETSRAAQVGLAHHHRGRLANPVSPKLISQQLAKELAAVVDGLQATEAEMHSTIYTLPTLYALVACVTAHDDLPGTKHEPDLWILPEDIHHFDDAVRLKQVVVVEKLYELASGAAQDRIPIRDLPTPPCVALNVKPWVADAQQAFVASIIRAVVGHEHLDRFISL